METQTSRDTDNPGSRDTDNPLSVESLTPRTSTYSTLRYELWKLESDNPGPRPPARPGPGTNSKRNILI